MQHNKSFLPAHEPFRQHKSLSLQSEHTAGALSFLRPTHAVFFHHSLHPTEKSNNAGDKAHGPPEPVAPDEQLASNVRFVWRSRDNRKGRHLLQYQSELKSDRPPAYIVPKKTGSVAETLKGMKRMFTCCPYWDVSYLVAITFFAASATWILNSFFLWLPLEAPETEFPSEIRIGGGVSAFIGATLFELGSLLLMIEAFNADRVGCFGWQVERVFGTTNEQELVRISPNLEHCIHHHVDKSRLVGIYNADEDIWQWLPSWDTFHKHCLREVGFLAAFAMFCGTTIFWISGFTALPGVIEHLSQAALNAVYWVPQIVGSLGFVISGLLYMFETQQNWHTPSAHVLGWHVGVWNAVGGIGFVLSGCLGPAYGNSGAQYQGALANFWGGWAFLLASTLQFYESLDKHSVEEV